MTETAIGLRNPKVRCEKDRRFIHGQGNQLPSNVWQERLSSRVEGTSISEASRWGGNFKHIFNSKTTFCDMSNPFLGSKGQEQGCR